MGKTTKGKLITKLKEELKETKLSMIETNKVLADKRIDEYIKEIEIRLDFIRHLRKQYKQMEEFNPKIDSIVKQLTEFSIDAKVQKGLIDGKTKQFVKAIEAKIHSKFDSTLFETNFPQLPDFVAIYEELNGEKIEIRSHGLNLDVKSPIICVNNEMETNLLKKSLLSIDFNNSTELSDDKVVEIEDNIKEEVKEDKITSESNSNVIQMERILFSELTSLETNIFNKIKAKYTQIPDETIIESMVKTREALISSGIDQDLTGVKVCIILLKSMDNISYELLPIQQISDNTNSSSGLDINEGIEKKTNKRSPCCPCS